MKKTKWYKNKKVWLVLFLVFLSWIAIYLFADNFKIRNPIIKRYPTTKKTGTSKKGAKNNQVSGKEIDFEKIYQDTRNFESGNGMGSNGIHKYCANQGMINEIGYKPKGKDDFCFKSELEQKETFISEMKDKMKLGYTIQEAICEWTTGTRQVQCNRTLDMGL